MDCAPKVCIAVINREKSSLARECARTSAHFGLIRRIKRDEKKCRLIGKWRCWILARLFECAPLRTHGHFEKIDYESQSWRNGCLDVIRAEGSCHRSVEIVVKMTKKCVNASQISLAHGIGSHQNVFTVTFLTTSECAGKEAERKGS